MRKKREKGLSAQCVGANRNTATKYQERVEALERTFETRLMLNAAVEANKSVHRLDSHSEEILKRAKKELGEMGLTAGYMSVPDLQVQQTRENSYTLYAVDADEWVVINQVKGQNAAHKVPAKIAALVAGDRAANEFILSRIQKGFIFPFGSILTATRAMREINALGHEVGWLPVYFQKDPSVFLVADDETGARLRELGLATRADDVGTGTAKPQPDHSRLFIDGAQASRLTYAGLTKDYNSDSDKVMADLAKQMWKSDDIQIKAFSSNGSELFESSKRSIERLLGLKKLLKGSEVGLYYWAARCMIDSFVWNQTRKNAAGFESVTVCFSHVKDPRLSLSTRTQRSYTTIVQGNPTGITLGGMDRDERDVMAAICNSDASFKGTKKELAELPVVAEVFFINFREFLADGRPLTQFLTSQTPRPISGKELVDFAKADGDCITYHK